MIEADARRLLDSRSLPVMAERLLSRRTVLGLLGASALVHTAGCGTNSPASHSRADQAEALHYLTLREIGRRIESRDLSPIDLAERMLDRIATVDRSLKSYATVMRVEALAAARAADQEIRAGKYRGPLHGVPVAVKDLCYAKGVRTMGGTKVRENFIPDVDATVVSRLRDAGAVLLGKLNLSEGATAGYNPARDVPPKSLESGSMARDVIERIGRRDGCRSVLRRHRYGHGRIDSKPGVCKRRGWTQTYLRPRQSLRCPGDGRVPRSCRADGAERHRRRHHVRCDRRTRSERSDLARRRRAAGTHGSRQGHPRRTPRRRSRLRAQRHRQRSGVPCGFSADGLPYSIQFTGRRLSESMLCRIAHAYERATEWHTHHPNLKTG
jgi:hypothetical protein